MPKEAVFLKDIIEPVLRQIEALPSDSKEQKVPWTAQLISNLVMVCLLHLLDKYKDAKMPLQKNDPQLRNHTHLKTLLDFMADVFKLTRHNVGSPFQTWRLRHNKALRILAEQLAQVLGCDPNDLLVPGVKLPPKAKLNEYILLKQKEGEEFSTALSIKEGFSILASKEGIALAAGQTSPLSIDYESSEQLWGYSKEALALFRAIKFQVGDIEGCRKAFFDALEKDTCELTLESRNIENDRQVIQDLLSGVGSEEGYFQDVKTQEDFLTIMINTPPASWWSFIALISTNELRKFILSDDEKLPPATTPDQESHHIAKKLDEYLKKPFHCLTMLTSNKNCTREHTYFV